ncbi:MAG: hypothetical protein A4E42_00360 [Methanoregulaceae archaeon PtaU1.Bin222]|nr:MAG: hypothetical protein A4E42_00360 [Methanoregulaceae archaeon PtaU1.Bin222]
MFIEPLPMPDAACTVPLIPGGRLEKNMLTSAPVSWQFIASAVESPGTVTTSSLPSPAAWSSIPAMIPSRNVVFPWAFEPATANTSLFRIPRPVMVRLLAGSSSSYGSSSLGQQNGMLIPSSGPAVRK